MIIKVKQGAWIQICADSGGLSPKTYFELAIIFTPRLVASLATGDLSAWNRLYDDFAPLLYGIILRQVPEELADVVLEKSLLSIYHRIDEFEPGNQRFFTWMYKITSETCSLAKADGMDTLSIMPDSGQPDINEIAG